MKRSVGGNRKWQRKVTDGTETVVRIREAIVNSLCLAKSENWLPLNFVYITLSIVLCELYFCDFSSVFGFVCVATMDRTSSSSNVPNEHDRKRQLAVQELIATEEGYIQALQIVKDLFFEPIRRGSLVNTDEFTLLTTSWLALETENTKLLK